MLKRLLDKQIPMSIAIICPAQRKVVYSNSHFKKTFFEDQSDISIRALNNLLHIKEPINSSREGSSLSKDSKEMP